MSYSIADIEGIGEAYAEKFHKAGIKTVEAFLEKCATPKGREEVEKAAGFAHETILKWANRADLMRVNGVAGQFSELLEQSGVDTVKELATRNAANLVAKMTEVNEQKNLVNRIPTVAEVQRMIDEAKTLPAVLKY